MLARGVGILCTVYFGSGAIIPYHGWGLVVWAILIVLMIVLFYLSVKYKSKIDIIINKIFRRKPQTSQTPTATTELQSTTEPQKDVTTEQLATIENQTNTKDLLSENPTNNENINITNNSADNKKINANITNNSADNKDKNNG